MTSRLNSFATTDSGSAHSLAMADIRAADQDGVEVVVAHHERATLRVGDVFLKVDADHERSEREVEAMRLAPVPTPRVLWRHRPVLALAAVPGAPIARLGEQTTSSPEAWEAAGRALRALHDAPVPPWSGQAVDQIASRLATECEWLMENDVLPAELVRANHQLAEVALRPWTPVFVHGDLQVAHVFISHDEVTGIVDWSEAGPGDAMYDLASLTLGHRGHLDDVVRGYGQADVDLEVVRAWWALRSLTAIRWLIEHEFDPFSPGCEVDVLRSLGTGTAR